jgi:RNA polymerase sigma-70 factor (ECF subfamily)
MTRQTTIVKPEEPTEPRERPLNSGNAEDIALFQRFLDGDDTAFMILFRRHTPRLYLYSVKILGNRQLANDIVQDVWERMARFRPEGRESPVSLFGLLIRTTRNLCINQLKVRDRNVSLEAMPEWQRPPAHTTEMTELEEAVVAALDYLPVEQREVIVLHTYCGYSYDEIAEMLEEPSAALRTRAWRARTRLARIIAELIGADNDRNISGGNPSRREREQ